MTARPVPCFVLRSPNARASVVFTGMRGRSRESASAFMVARPILRPLKLPGPMASASLSISLVRVRAVFMASIRKTDNFSMWIWGPLVSLWKRTFSPSHNATEQISDEVSQASIIYKSSSLGASIRISRLLSSSSARLKLSPNASSGIASATMSAHSITTIAPDS